MSDHDIRKPDWVIEGQRVALYTSSRPLQVGRVGVTPSGTPRVIVGTIRSVAPKSFLVQEDKNPHITYRVKLDTMTYRSTDGYGVWQVAPRGSDTWGEIARLQHQDKQRRMAQEACQAYSINPTNENRAAALKALNDAPPLGR